MKYERNYGIDLLCLVLMYMVCMLHTLGQGGILGVCQAGTVEYKAFWFLEILSYCAVDGFAIISGYMAVDRPRKYEKLVDMWFQAFFYSFVITMLFPLAGCNPVWEKADMIRCAFPVTFGKFWYFTAFFALFFAIPILNKFMFTVEEQSAKIAFLILIILFSCMGLFADAFKTQGGYSTLWLIILYCIGALAKRGKVFEQKKSFTLIIMWAICIFWTWAAHVFQGNEQLTNFVSPTILLSGLLMVILFSRIRLKGTVIAKLSPLAFGIYLFQLNQVIWNNYLRGAFTFVAETNIILGVVYAFACAALIFISGLVVEFLRTKIAKVIKIPELSKKIVSVFHWMLKKVCVILK